MNNNFQNHFFHLFFCTFDQKHKFMDISITVVIVAVTVIVSIIGFTSKKAMEDLIFYPAVMEEKGGYHRFLTYGFIHADIMHLIFNMYAFYLFGEYTEKSFGGIFGPMEGRFFYVSFYLLALIVSVIPDFIKYKHNYYYRSLGASGAVSAIVFAYIMLNPIGGIGLIFIPIFIPGFIFGILFLVISYYLGRRGGGRINHNAHMWGALFGVVFMIVFSKFFSDYPVLENFIQQVRGLEWQELFQTY